ncbi:F5 8 type C domain protein [Rutstroemia sp. NJR-2017a WRK4]|nr:F5 8 type C domain protein [Rutstroemia sp. NJR-2017a WRK4]
MYLTTSFLLSTLLYLPTVTSQNFQSSSKRGLVFVPNDKHPSDNQIWDSGNSDLNWYYNYGVLASAAFSNRTQAEFEFVPMLWSTSTSFLSSVQSLISDGRNISHVLGYNEPDGESSTGGSSISATAAATNWISQMEPLRKLGVKTGAPAVTGSQRGLTWLEHFFDACAAAGTNCTADFIPVHWYGNFEGLASYLGQVRAAYPNTSIWVTEYALNNASLPESQDFFKTSAEYFDRLDFIDRYSYFGSFRSSVSNVGPNASMLDQDGQLTDIGSWYLGGAATGHVPEASGAARISGGWTLWVGLLGAGLLLL